MVFVIVEIAREDIGDVVNRLLGARHKIQVVEEVRDACDCRTSMPQVKRPRTEIIRAAPQHSPDLISSSANQQEGEGNEEGTSNMNMSLLEMVKLASGTPGNPETSASPAKDSPLSLYNSSMPKWNYSATRRNNGVPYNSGVLYPHVKSQETEDEPKEEYPEGVDMAIKCTLCDRTIALGTRPQNHSTRKYAHARCHGFKNRFECNLCHAVFKNKRVTFNHNRTMHGDDPTFELIDRWNEAAQRDLMLMVKKCFPKDNKPFVKEASYGSLENEDDDTMEEIQVKEEIPDTDNFKHAIPTQHFLNSLLPTVNQPNQANQDLLQQYSNSQPRNPQEILNSLLPVSSEHENLGQMYQSLGNVQSESEQAQQMQPNIPTISIGAPIEFTLS